MISRFGTYAELVIRIWVSASIKPHPDVHSSLSRDINESQDQRVRVGGQDSQSEKASSLRTGRRRGARPGSSEHMAQAYHNENEPAPIRQPQFRLKRLFPCAADTEDDEKSQPSKKRSFVSLCYTDSVDEDEDETAEPARSQSRFSSFFSGKRSISNDDGEPPRKRRSVRSIFAASATNGGGEIDAGVAPESDRLIAGPEYGTTVVVEAKVADELQHRHDSRLCANAATSGDTLQQPKGRSDSRVQALLWRWGWRRSSAHSTDVGATVRSDEAVVDFVHGIMAHDAAEEHREALVIAEAFMSEPLEQRHGFERRLAALLDETGRLGEAEQLEQDDDKYKPLDMFNCGQMDFATACDTLFNI